jgi:hypothetical protein
VLAQIPSAIEAGGIALVVGGVAFHQSEPRRMRAAAIAPKPGTRSS